MPVAVATKDSCPWCTEPDKLSVETLSGGVVFETHQIAFCLECGSPIGLTKGETPARVTEAQARHLLSAADWETFCRYQRFARTMTPERRAAILVEIAKLAEKRQAEKKP